MEAKLKVLPNPYAAIDHEGVPSGACPADPQHGGGNLIWPGARLDLERTKLGQHQDLKENPAYAQSTERSAPQRTRFVFSADIVEIPDTPHYRMALRCGDLVPGDADASSAAQLPEHRDPYLVLAEKRALAIENWIAAYGKAPAFADDDALDPFPELKEVSAKILDDRKTAREQAMKNASALAAKSLTAAKKTRPDIKGRASAAYENAAKKTAQTVQAAKATTTTPSTPTPSGEQKAEGGSSSSGK